MDNQELRGILKRIAEKDNAAFEDLYKGYSKVIYGIALSLLKNEENCNDVVQLVMSKLFTMPKENFPTSHELTWLYAVTKNEALQLLRKERPYIPLDDVFSMESITDELTNAVDMDAYRDMIKSLDEKSKAIVTLKVIAGFSHKEIGKLLHMPTGTVQWKYYTAIHKLRIALTNLALFIAFGLLDIIYIISKPIDNQKNGGILDTPGIIDQLAKIDSLSIALAALALLSLTVSLIFFVKARKCQQNNRPGASK